MHYVQLYKGLILPSPSLGSQQEWDRVMAADSSSIILRMTYGWWCVPCGCRTMSWCATLLAPQPYHGTCASGWSQTATKDLAWGPFLGIESRTSQKSTIFLCHRLNGAVWFIKLDLILFHRNPKVPVMAILQRGIGINITRFAIPTFGNNLMQLGLMHMSAVMRVYWNICRYHVNFQVFTNSCTISDSNMA